MAEEKVFPVYECNCACHKGEGVSHVTACCHVCDHCGLRIRIGAHAIRLHGEVCEGNPTGYEKPPEADESPSV